MRLRGLADLLIVELGLDLAPGVAVGEGGEQSAELQFLLALPTVPELCPLIYFHYAGEMDYMQ
jgi:hypothetical protein